jgi:hypothetical protein
MALSKDVLGMALYNREQAYNNKAPDELGDLDTARQNFWKDMADEIINHIHNNSLLIIPGAGLAAGAVPVTGTAITGTIS